MNEIKLMLTIIGYNPKKIPIIPICSYSGDNLFEQSKDPNLNWWNETGFQIKTHKIQSLIQALKYMSKKVKPLNKNINITKSNSLCLTIKSRIENKKIGPIHLARIDCGQIKINQTILCFKSKNNIPLIRKYNIKSMQSHNKNIKIAKIGTVIGFTFVENINNNISNL